MMRRVVIIGAGALGRCLAALLKNHAAVTLCERDPVIRRALQGTKIDALIFTTKIMGLRTAVKEAAKLEPQCVFFPQNGIFDINWTKRYFRKAKICRGVATMACQATGPGKAILFYRGNIYLGGDGAELLAGLFREAGIGTKVYRDPAGAVWAKLIFSAVMNPLPVITGQGYGVLKTDKETWELVQQAVEEGRMVARSLKVRLAFDPLQLIHRVRDGDLAGIPYRGTMVQDISAGRPTELDYITGALIRQARRKGIKTPALDSILLEAKLAGA